MRPLSSTALHLLERLHRQRGPLERMMKRHQGDVEILLELATLKEPALVPELLQFLLGTSPPVREAATRAVATNLDAASLEEIIELDELCRRRSSYSPPGGWASLSPIELSRFSDFGPMHLALLAVASFHANGYVREAAVEQLDVHTDGRELPFLLLRANDWVDPVSVRAGAALGRRAGPEYAVTFLRHAVLLERLRRSGRRLLDPLLDRIDSMIAKTEHRDQLLEALSSTDRQTRSLALRIGLRTLDGRLEVAQRALRDGDSGIRLTTARCVSSSFTVHEAVSVVGAMLVNPFPPVRREGIIVASRSGHYAASERIEDALFDRSRLVREAARFHLRRAGYRTDFADGYRKVLLAADRMLDTTVIAALGGLAETGTGEDVRFILPFCAHARPAMRVAAVHATGILDGQGQIETLIAALHDPSPGVSRAARDQLQRRASSIVNHLGDALRPTNAPHVRRNAILLVNHVGKWVSLPLLIRATADSDVEVRGLARRGLTRWIDHQNRAMVAPTSTQLRAIHDALDANVLAIERGVARELRSVIDAWSA